jgi:hypothetical protein
MSVASAFSTLEDISPLAAVTLADTDTKGSDTIDLPYGVIKAVLDDADDVFVVPFGHVSYVRATQPIIVTDNGVWGEQIGLDQVVANQLQGGSGDDVLWGFDRLIGGAGNDTITAGHFASGGSGDDLLITDNSGARVRLLGDAGDDTFIIRYAAEVTGGTGHDTFRFEGDGWGTINDLSPGDRIDLTGLIAPSVDNPWSGYLMTEISGGYTTLWFDPDGGGDAYASLIVLKGVFTNLGDYLLI